MCIFHYVLIKQVCFLISYVCLLYLQVIVPDECSEAVTCNPSSSARAEKVAFALPNVCYQVRLPAIWIGVSISLSCTAVV